MTGLFESPDNPVMEPPLLEQLRSGFISVSTRRKNLLKTKTPRLIGSNRALKISKGF